MLFTVEKHASFIFSDIIAMVGKTIAKGELSDIT